MRKKILAWKATFLKRVKYKGKFVVQLLGSYMYTLPVYMHY